MKKELIGVVAVPTGQLLIIDPSCLDSPNHKLSLRDPETAGAEHRYGQITPAGSGNAQTAFAVNSGYGGGAYGVYATWDQNGKIAGVEIDFRQMYLTEESDIWVVSKETEPIL